MLDDLSLELQTSSEEYRQQVLLVKDHKISRDFVERWAGTLRFLCAVGDQNTDEDNKKGAPGEAPACACQRKGFFDGQSSILRVSSKDPPEVPGCTHYVAVSYCWQAQDQTLPKYTVRTQHLQRRNIAPSPIIDRAIAFAQRHGVKLVWIDQECIVQEDRDDKEQGIQSMDLVYQRSSHPVALLSNPIESQAHLSALLKTMMSSDEMEPSDFADALQALENIAHDRWFKRTWCFQEVVAVGESMRLLIPCDESFQGGDEYRRVRGEFEIPVHSLRAMALWIYSWADGMQQYHHDNLDVFFSTDITSRAKSVYTQIMQVCPVAYDFGSGEQDSNFRYGCNAASALQMMREKKNRRVSDRLAILANICNFRTRLNTHELEALEVRIGSELSFSICATVLALMNGDVSIQAGSRAEAEKRGIRSSPPLSWLPLNEIPLGQIQCFDEFHGTIMRMANMGICDQGLQISGHLWHFDRKIDMSDIQERFAERYDIALLKATEHPFDIGTGEIDDPNNLLREVFFFVVLKLCANKLAAVANVLWHGIRSTAVVADSNSGTFDLSSGDHEARLEWSNVPDQVDDLLSPLFTQSADNSVSIQHQYDNYIRRFFFSDDLTFERGYAWLIRTVISQGYLGLWSLAGNDQQSASSEIPLAVFDLDSAETVGFTPACEQLECHPRSRLATEPIAWAVEETQEVVSGGGKLLHGLTMTRGLWRTHNVSPMVFVIGY